MADWRATIRHGAPAEVANSAQGLFGEPVFVNAAGQASVRPLDLLPPRRVIDLAGLAALFSSPALELEFMPASPWQGLTLHRARPQWPQAASDPAELHDQFAASVRRCMADADTVAVLFSGGLDSLAVLLHARAIARRQDRRVIAVIVDLTDDQGVRVGGLARSLLSEFAPECDAVLIDDNPDGLPEPPWRPTGPRLRGLPRLNRAANEAAYRHGATVLLNGSGADEFFMARNYLTGPLARARRWSDLTCYLRDVCRYYGPAWGLVRESLAMLGPLAGRRRSFQLYASVQMPALASSGQAEVLSPGLRQAAVGYSRQWLAERAERDGAIPWSAALARDLLHPLDLMPGHGPAAECSPYMDAGFSWYAAGLPPAAAFSAVHRVPYHRHKALVLSLLPPGAAAKLPAGKQQFADAFERYFDRVLAGRRLTGVACGFFDRGLSLRLEQDSRLPPVCHGIDVWLEGAMKEGTTVA